MQDQISEAKAMADIIRRQEEALQFDRFDAEDAWAIGQSLRQHASIRGANVSIHIARNGVTLFHTVAGQPSPNNDRWVARKTGTVLEFFKSSLLVAKEMAATGRTLLEFGLSESGYALSGGGFPIRLKSGGVVGAIVVSGMPQLNDHQLIVDVLSEYLHVQTESVLAFGA